MKNIYIDESGSITKQVEKDTHSFFIISLIVVNNDKVLNRNLKHFIRSNMKVLKKVDTENKMFIENKFVELKGAAFNAPLKRKFVEKIIEESPFELYYIKLLNKQVDENFIEYKARTFNYLLKIFFEHNLRNKNFKDEEYFLQIDERNIKTQAKFLLPEYLNTELILNDNLLSKSLNVRYFDSSNNKFIQVADVFSNLFYSECLTNAYTDLFTSLKKKKILKEIFIFPRKKG